MLSAGGRPPTMNEPDTILRLQPGRHTPVHIVGEGKKTNISRMCTVCEAAEKSKYQKENPGQKRKRYGHETRYQCRYGIFRF